MLWGTACLFVRSFDRWGWTALDIAGARTTCSLLMLAAGLALARRQLFRIPRKDLPLFFLAGFAGAGTSQPLFMFTLIGTPAAVAVLLNYTAPLFVVIIARLFLKERITLAKLGSLLLSLAGLVLVTGILPHGETLAAGIRPLALLTGLGSGFFYAVNLLLTRRLSSDYSPFTIQVWGPLCGLPVLLGIWSLWPYIGAAAGQPAARAVATLPPLHAASIGTCLLMSAGPGLAGFLLVTYGLSYVQAGRASILLTVEPVVATILGYTVLGEQLDLTQLLGMGLVLAGIVTVSFTGSESAPSSIAAAPRPYASPAQRLSCEQRSCNTSACNYPPGSA